MGCQNGCWAWCWCSMGYVQASRCSRIHSKLFSPCCFLLLFSADFTFDYEEKTHFSFYNMTHVWIEKINWLRYIMMLMSSSCSLWILDHSVFLLFRLQLDACNGYYCDSFIPNSKKKPMLWTENWDGW